MMGSKYDDLIRRIAEEIIPGFDWRRIKAQAMAESQLRLDALSPAGAIGIMQIMPATGQDLGYSPEDLREPEKNIRAGVEYMRLIFKGWEQVQDPAQWWEFALASYNAGPGNIRRAVRKAESRGYETCCWSAVAPHLADITGKHARETINYVARVRQAYHLIRKEKS